MFSLDEARRLTDGAREKAKLETVLKNSDDETNNNFEDVQSLPGCQRKIVLKIGVSCDGCRGKIIRTIRGMKGVESMRIDGGKDLVTVRGTMDPVGLVSRLKRKLRREVDLVSINKYDREEKKLKQLIGIGGDDAKFAEITLGGDIIHQVKEVAKLLFPLRRIKLSRLKNNWANLRTENVYPYTHDLQLLLLLALVSNSTFLRALKIKGCKSEEEGYKNNFNLDRICQIVKQYPDIVQLVIAFDTLVFIFSMAWMMIIFNKLPLRSSLLVSSFSMVGAYYICIISGL